MSENKKENEEFAVRVGYKTNEENERKLKALADAEDRSVSSMLRVLVDRAWVKHVESGGP